MEILIVAKTHMKNGACVGGFELSTKKDIRLLNAGGENQPKNTEFEVGQIWDIEYTIRENMIPPHVEDVIINSKKFVGTQSSINSFLKTSALVWKGVPENIFQNKLQFATGQSGYLQNKTNLPTQSVGFWLPDSDLELTILDDQKHFFYFGSPDGPQIYAFPYVGFSALVETIKVGTLVRVSLARWWSPNSDNEHRRCYCQLSGWYVDG